MTTQDKAPVWSMALEKHMYGEYSLARTRSSVKKQLSQVETLPSGMFFGIYDGHEGWEASKFVSINLFKKLTENNANISTDTIKQAFIDTESSFIDLVDMQLQIGHWKITGVGTSCLVGIICEDILYVANLGSSRAILGILEKKKIELCAISRDHVADSEEIREELRTLYPNDKFLFACQDDSWRVKGWAKVTKSIGDGYLKHNHLRVHRPHMKYFYDSDLHGPALSSEPEIQKIQLSEKTKFLVLASKDFWDLLEPDELVNIITTNDRMSVAWKLISEAWNIAKNAKSGCGTSNSTPPKMTVFVIFFDGFNGNANNSFRPFEKEGTSLSSMVHKAGIPLQSYPIESSCSSRSRQELLLMSLDERLRVLFAESSQVQRFDALMHYVSQYNDEDVLGLLPEHADLVQGVWVYKSVLLYEGGFDAVVRDYVLLLFSKNHRIPFAELKWITSDAQMRVLGPLSKQRILLKDWKFKEPTDISFMKRYPRIVEEQKALWTNREKSIMDSLYKGLGRSLPMPPANTDPTAGV